MAKKSQQKTVRLKQNSQKSQSTPTAKVPKKSTQPVQKSKLPRKKPTQPARKTTDNHTNKKRTKTQQKRSHAQRPATKQTACLNIIQTKSNRTQKNTPLKDNGLTIALSEVRVKKIKDNTKINTPPPTARITSPSLLGLAITNTYVDLNYQPIFAAQSISDDHSDSTFFDITERVNDMVIDSEPAVEPVIDSKSVTQRKPVMHDASTNTDCTLESLQSIIDRYGARLHTICDQDATSCDGNDDRISESNDAMDTPHVQLKSADELGNDNEGSTDDDLEDLFQEYEDEDEEQSEISASPPEPEKMYTIRQSSPHRKDQNNNFDFQMFSLTFILIVAT